MKIKGEDVAFPVPDTVATQILGGYGFPIEYMGLTKREYFIAMAFQGLLTKYNLKTPADQEVVAKLSIELTDTLINELNK